jgi:RHS repeat-associated protein
VSLFTHGIEVEGSRDVAGRPTARRTFKKSLAAAAMGFAVGMLATPSFAQPQREEVDARVYQWRGEDQIAGIVDAASGPKFYDHDARGRLVRERRPDVVVERAMGAVGNVYRSRTGTDRRYGPGGRLEMADGIRYEHDEDGNQTLKSGPDGDWHYRWNGHGMVREVERPDGVRVAFDYDPFARRTAKRTLSAAGTVDQEVQFVWDGHNVIHELDSDRGLISWQWEPESFTPIAKEHAGRRWTIASDHLGTPTEMYDDVGQLAWKMQLDVFGVPRLDAGTAEDCPWRWPGRYEDSGIGLFYNRWRYFESARGSYASQDPLGLLGGPEWFCYVADPLSSDDPLGLARRGGYMHPAGVWITSGGNPRLESSYNNRLPADMRAATVSDARQMRSATRSLRDAIDSGAVSAADFTKRQLTAIRAGAERIPGLTWHHHENGSLLQLVDRRTHRAVGHDGGRARVGGRC